MMHCFMFGKCAESQTYLLCLQFPLLLPGEKEFVYESCTPLQSPTGSVKGSFTFVPGRYSAWIHDIL